MAKMKNHPVDMFSPERAKTLTSPGPAFEPDLVDRMLEYLVELLPEIRENQSSLSLLELQIRRRFAGRNVYIPVNSPLSKIEMRREVLKLWNGRNATSVARALGISRASVYRYLE